MAKVIGLLVYFLLAIAVHSAASVGCISETNKPVDWWFIYKLPALPNNQDPSLRDGYGYAYLDANNDELIRDHDRLLSSKTSGSLTWTLDQIYKSQTVGYIMFNDQTPDGKASSSRGHTKGVLGFNSNTGFLLRHSTPRYPYYHKDGYDGYPDYATTYGQTFLCISVSIDTISELAAQFMVNMANVYDSMVPTAATQYKPIVDLAADKMTNQIRSSVIEFKSANGQTFTDVAKSKICQCEIYSDIVAPLYKSDLLALTWGRPLAPSYCKPEYQFDVANVLNLTWTVNQTAYKETKEHSKWAIAIDFDTNSYPAEGPIVCVGDINRMESQRNRGGGLSCFLNKGLWIGFNKLIDSVAECPLPERYYQTLIHAGT